ncbi:hypothetical protein [Asticcacaulis sp. EMRT-3]|uniref:hypothetical protein n=1 Tax=Asticcacaulis sp. EMRT-3 TaxID=3040349 RepID=UPI0024AF2F5C|nr:hypothetical protein [Asticcacaulis sp. EMRT-3]MDI7775895.1 hypothetical protein [Asticcacaulis sp. EMRT-3]
MNRKTLLWAMALVVIVPAVLGGAYWVYWDQVVRFAPVVISNPDDVPKIQSLLDRVDYVSPGPQTRFVYLVTYRNCVPCNDYQRKEFPKLQAAGVETRVIVFARPDNQNIAQSSPEERSTVAELWLNRSWPLYVQWFNTPNENWKATGLPVADKDMARSGVVWASRDFVDELGPILRRNKVNVGYPLIIWRDGDHQLKVCNCASEKAYPFIRQDFGIDSDLEAAAKGLLNLPARVLSPGSEASSASVDDGPDGGL